MNSEEGFSILHNPPYFRGTRRFSGTEVNWVGISNRWFTVSKNPEWNSTYSSDGFFSGISTIFFNSRDLVSFKCWVWGCLKDHPTPSPNTNGTGIVVEDSRIIDCLAVVENCNVRFSFRILSTSLISFCTCEGNKSIQCWTLNIDYSVWYSYITCVHSNTFLGSDFYKSFPEK